MFKEDQKLMMNLSGPPSSYMCSGCGEVIRDRFYVLAVDRPWHNSCLKCNLCGVILSDQLTCFARDGMILCKEDYYKTFGGKAPTYRCCSRCLCRIDSSELIMKAKDLIYHLKCFVCDICMCSLNRGEHFGMSNSTLYCKYHLEMISASEGQNHPHHHNNHHHHRSPNEHVHNLSHPNGNCNPIHPMTNGNHPYSENVLPRPTTLQLSPVPYNGNTTGRKGRPKKKKMSLPPNCPSQNQNPNNPQPQQQPGDISLPMPGNGLVPGPGGMQLGDISQHLNFNSGSMEEFLPSGACIEGTTGPRTKRMRTTFKHQQLRLMKSYFDVNPNPDAKDLKSLAQKTGLCKRVLQVWFQNARAKSRRVTPRRDLNLHGVETPTGYEDMQSNPSSDAFAPYDALSRSANSDDGGFCSDIH